MADTAADLYLTASRSAPTLDPQMVYGVAQSSGDINDVADHAQAIESFGEITRRVQNLKRQSSKVQISAWSSLSMPEQKLYAQAGYVPPELKREHGGVFHALTHNLATDVAGVVAKPVGRLAGKEARFIGGNIVDVAEGLNAGLRAGQHLFRAAALIDEDNKGGGGLERWSGRAWGAAFSPEEWSRAWRQSKHGEDTYSPHVVRKLNTKYGEDKVAVARRVAAVTASGFKGPGDPDYVKLTRGMSQEDAQQLVDQLRTDPEIHEIVGKLMANKISFGRRVVGAGLLEHHPAAAGFVSGLIDGTADFFADPTVHGLKVAKELGAMRYLVGGEESAARLAANPNVQRKAADVARFLKDGEYGALIERYPRYASILQGEHGLAETVKRAVDEGASHQEAVVDYFTKGAGLQAILTGRVSGAHAAVPTMPYLTRAGEVRLAAKGALKGAIDFAADRNPIGWLEGLTEKEVANGGLLPADRIKASLGYTGDRALKGVGQFARKFTTIAARGAEFDPSSPEAVTMIQRLGHGVLGANRTRQVVDAWVAAPNQGARRDIYKGLLGEMFRAAGWDATPAGREAVTRFLATIDETATKQIYGVGRGGELIDRIAGPGETLISAPITTSQLSNLWSLPSYRTLTANARRVGLMGLMNKTVNADLADKFIQSAWKPMQLLRLGFPARAGGEELFSAIMREGIRPIVAGRLAATAVSNEPTVFSRALRSMFDRLPEGVDFVADPVENVARIMGHKAHGALRGFAGRLAPDAYVDAARNPAVVEAFGEHLSAVHGHAGGYLDHPATAGKLNAEGKLVTLGGIKYRPSGAFKLAHRVDELHAAWWKKSLDDIASDPLGKAALEHLGDPRDVQVRAIADAIDAPEYAKLRARNIRATRLRDGRVVGVDATAREATEDWAQVYADHVDALVKSPDGQLIGDLHERLLAEGKAPTTSELQDTPLERRPEFVKSREVVPVYKHPVSEIISKGFDEIVGRPMNWMIREPLFLHHVAEATPLIEKGLARTLADMDPKAARALVQELAIDRAVNKTIPFVHDPELRSQFSEITRNLAPFWFAQEQFYKRWARILTHSPEAIREVQLFMMGLRHSGFLHKNEDGQEYFMYPGVQFSQNMLTRFANLVPGVNITTPLPVGFSGQVRFVSPGTERLGLPSFGPLVAVPMTSLAKLFPELSGVEEKLLSERGAGRSLWEQVVPTTVTRLYHTFADNPEKSPQMASAMMQAYAYMEANGLTPPENATPSEREAFTDSLKQWTRTLMLLRTFYGYSVPAAPELQLDPDNLHLDMRRLVGSLGIEKGIAEFMKLHPDATPYTIFQSKSVSGANLPATAQAARFMEDHRELLSSYPMAGGWLIPQSPAGTKFSLAAYREQLGLHLRRRKDFNQFYDDVKYAEAAQDYFDTRDAKNKALESHKGDSQAIDRITQKWATWSRDFKKQHPIFAEHLEAVPSVIQRQQVLTQTIAALRDPRLPDNKQTRALGDLVDTYTALNEFVARSAGNRLKSAVDARRNARLRFVEWAKRFVEENPEARGFYDRAIRPDVETE